MNKAVFILPLILLVILVSGCTQTGQIISKDAGQAHQELNDNLTQNQTPSAITQPEPAQNQTQANTISNQTPNQTAIQLTDPCQNITCQQTTKACPDNYTAACTNSCSNSTGQCSSCTPDCTGHEAVCTKTCSTCEQLDKPQCLCQAIIPCCGNSICESPENSTSCQADCPVQTQQQPPQSPIISEIMYNPTQSEYYNEWVEIYNPSQSPVSLEGWTFCGDALIPGYVRYPDKAILNENGFSIPAGGRALITDGDSGTEVYANFNVAQSIALHIDDASLCDRGLSNTNKTVTLKDSSNNTVDGLTYFSDWGANGNGKSLSKATGQWAESEPTPGS